MSIPRPRFELLLAATLTLASACDREATEHEQGDGGPISDTRDGGPDGGDGVSDQGPCQGFGEPEQGDGGPEQGDGEPENRDGGSDPEEGGPETITDEPDEDDERDFPGSDCSCDSECLHIPDHRPICVFGICMLRPVFRQTCEGPMRTCPPDMHLREVYEYGGFVCYPLCDAFECEGDCDRFGVCIDTEDTDFWCDPTCAAYCSDDSLW